MLNCTEIPYPTYTKLHLVQNFQNKACNLDKSGVPTASNVNKVDN